MMLTLLAKTNSKHDGRFLVSKRSLLAQTQIAQAPNSVVPKMMSLITVLFVFIHIVILVDQWLMMMLFYF
eukprot:m.374072 g.374072  ORF g.374072 m.374072 type:complete len:70 (+) comp70404_c0_seq1:1-210(+)